MGEQISQAQNGNPYASPSAESTQLGGPNQWPPEVRAELKVIATYQKYVLYCVVIQFIAFFAIGFLASLMPSFQNLVVFAGFGAICIASVACAVLLATRLFGAVPGTIFGAFAIIPCLNLVALLYLNLRATAWLREHGVAVGFFGADLDSI